MARMAAHEVLKPVVCVQADNYGAGTVNGSEIDTAGFEELLLVVDAGVTNGTVDVKLQHATASGGTFTDISGAAIAQVTPSTDATIYAVRLNLRNANRYVRAVLTTTGTSSKVSVTAVLANPETWPVSQVNAAVSV